MDTKLTIKLPESLRRRAKAVAALRGESISDVVRTALEAYIAEELEETEDARAIEQIERRIAEGRERLYSHDDVWQNSESDQSEQ